MSGTVDSRRRPVDPTSLSIVPCRTSETVGGWSVGRRSDTELVVDSVLGWVSPTPSCPWMRRHSIWGHSAPCPTTTVDKTNRIDDASISGHDIT